MDQTTERTGPNVNTKRKNTGRTDKYSDESTRKDYADFRKDHPKDEFRKDMKEDGDIDKQNKSVEFLKQEIIAHYQTFQETWIPSRKRRWELKLEQLEKEFKLKF